MLKKLIALTAVTAVVVTLYKIATSPSIPSDVDDGALETDPDEVEHWIPFN